MTHQVHPDYFNDPGVQAVVRVFAAHAPGKMRFVGGCVRDAILGRRCNDVDFATPLIPAEVTRIFVSEGFHVEPTGIEHGTVTVIWNHMPFEITTLRRDVETDGRRAVVEFTDSWAEDAERRDFTMNALYMDEEGFVHDPFGNGKGIEDAVARRLVFVGDAETRIREDALRIVRLFRFMATLGATPDENAIAASTKLAHLIEGLSGERLEKEAVKLVGAPGQVHALRAMADAGVFPFIFFFDPTRKEVEKIVDRLERQEANSVAASPLNMLWLWDVDIAEKVCQRWKTSHQMRKDTVDLMRDGPIDLTTMRRDSIWEDAHRTSPQSVIGRLRMSWIDKPVIPLSDMLTMADHVHDKPEFPIRGQDLLDAGMKPGREIGQRLKAIEEWWIASGFPDEAAVRQHMREVIA